jgi:hypothetical protein
MSHQTAPQHMKFNRETESRHVTAAPHKKESISFFFPLALFEFKEEVCIMSCGNVDHSRILRYEIERCSNK